MGPPHGISSSSLTIEMWVGIVHFSELSREMDRHVRWPAASSVILAGPRRGRVNPISIASSGTCGSHLLGARDGMIPVAGTVQVGLMSLLA